MEYLSVKETAMKLSVTERAVQKWAKEGKIFGAKKFSGAWLIPDDFTVPDTTDSKKTEKKHTAMLLMNTDFSDKSCESFINSLEDDDDRKLALGEYYYYIGQPEKAIEMIEEYLYSSDEPLKYWASLVCLFAGMAAGKGTLASFSLKLLNEQFENGFKKEEGPTEPHSIAVFTAMTVHVLLDIPVDSSIPKMNDYMSALPGGIKLQACYVLAHQAYLNKEYERALAIADIGLYLSPKRFPVPTIYVNIVATMALMKLRRIDEAKERIKIAWELACKDGIIQPFIEHYALLQGLIETMFKKDSPKLYKRIVDSVYIFHDAWSNIHNLYAENSVTKKLSTTEFIIAMLYGHGWSVKEVAAHMDLSSRTVTNYISTIYSKLYINDRKDLVKHILK